MCSYFGKFPLILVSSCSQLFNSHIPDSVFTSDETVLKKKKRNLYLHPLHWNYYSNYPPANLCVKEWPCIQTFLFRRIILYHFPKQRENYSPIGVLDKVHVTRVQFQKSCLAYSFRVISRDIWETK